MNALSFVPLLLAAILGLRSLRIVQQGNSVLVERLRTFSRTLKPGVNIVVPLLEKEVSTQSLKERVLDVPPQDGITKDNVKISVDAVIYWQLVDHYKGHYAILDMEAALMNLVLTQIRAEVGLMSLDQTFSARQEVNDRLLAELDDATDPWGIKVTRVELQDILPSPSVVESMEKQMTAERRKRATVLDSEGEKEAAINVARGRAEALVLDAEAQSRAVVVAAEASAQQQKLLAEARGQAAAALAEVLQQHPTAAEALRLLLAKDWMTMGEQLAQAKGGSVLMVDPQSPASLLAALRNLQQRES